MTLEYICDALSALVEKARKPMTYIPAALLVCSAINRPGLSVMTVAANIIRRQTEAGAPVGPSADGSPSIAERMERIRVEEIFKAIKLDANVQIGLPIGGIKITGTGANAGGPVVIKGFNNNAAHGQGIVS